MLETFSKMGAKIASIKRYTFVLLPVATHTSNVEIDFSFSEYFPVSNQKHCKGKGGKSDSQKLPLKHPLCLVDLILLKIVSRIGWSLQSVNYIISPYSLEAFS